MVGAGAGPSAVSGKGLCPLVSAWLTCVIACLCHYPLGYSVAAIFTGNGVHFVAGAPRANYTGQVVLYSVNEKGNVSIVQATRGDQVSPTFGRWN